MRTSIQRLVIGGCVVGALILALHARPLIAMRLIGLDGRAMLRDGDCGPTVHIWQGTVCNQFHLDRPLPSYATSMQLTSWTRQLERASRDWKTSDSSTWQTRVDSIHGAMQRARYDRVSCDGSSTGFLLAEAWRAGGSEVRLYGGSISGRGVRPTSWLLVVMVVPRATVGCGISPSRELHLERIPQLLQQWLASHFDTPIQ